MLTDNPGQGGQERGELLLELLAAELAVGVLQAIVGHQVGGPSDFAFA